MNCPKYTLSSVPPNHTANLPKAGKQNKNEPRHEMNSRMLMEILLAAKMQDWLASEDTLITQISASCSPSLLG